jgi:FlaG/FlaF family flagellin (archaellin)
MIAVATKGGNKYIGADPIIFNAHEVGLKIQAASTYMTVGYLAWFLEGMINLVATHGYWDEKIELRDRRLGILATEMIGKP